MEKSYYWYTVTVQFLTEDEQSGKIKKVKETHLVKAVSITDAETQMALDLEGLIADYRILNVTESKIVRVIKPTDVELNS
jgi:hypothetical protein